MKSTTLILVIVLVIFWIASLFWVKSCNQPEPVKPDDREIRSLKQQNAALKDSNKTLSGLNAGLKQTIKEKDGIIYQLKAQTVSEVARIDSTIKKDPTRALPEYRLALNKLGIQTDEGPVTLRELGFGALFLTEVPGLRLQVKYYEDEKSNYEKIIANKDKIIDNDARLFDNQAKITALEIKNKDYYRALYEDTQGFWHKRFNLSLSTGFFYTGKEFVPGVGLSAGITLWAND